VKITLQKQGLIQLWSVR